MKTFDLEKIWQFWRNKYMGWFFYIRMHGASNKQVWNKQAIKNSYLFLRVVSNPFGTCVPNLSLTMSFMISLHCKRNYLMIILQTFLTGISITTYWTLIITFCTTDTWLCFWNQGGSCYLSNSFIHTFSQPEFPENLEHETNRHAFCPNIWEMKQTDNAVS